MKATVGVSSMTLGGLLKHVALVEDSHFAIKLPGQEPGPPRDAVDWEADPGWEWRTGAQDDPAAVLALWQASWTGPAPLSPGRWPTAASTISATIRPRTAADRPACGACSST